MVLFVFLTSWTGTVYRPLGDALLSAGTRLRTLFGALLEAFGDLSDVWQQSPIPPTQRHRHCCVSVGIAYIAT
jgi:hypothetical protein